MVKINERIRLLRKEYLNLTQEQFASEIKISRSNLGSIEVGRINVTDRVIEDICSQFSVNEDWLRYGKGEMFVQPDEFSLDEYAKKNNLTELELDIIKGYMDLDSGIRKEIMSHFKTIFNKHSEISVTKEEDHIESELEKYRLELEAELKGATSLASDDIGEKSN